MPFPTRNCCVAACKILQPERMKTDQQMYFAACVLGWGIEWVSPTVPRWHGPGGQILVQRAVGQQTLCHTSKTLAARPGRVVLVLVGILGHPSLRDAAPLF